MADIDTRLNLLEVVNEHDEVIGLKPRAEIHAQGLRHREIYIWIELANHQLIFQRRSPTKDLFPNMLDNSVGGHVEIGDTYLTTAIKEMAEETGIVCEPEDLIELGKIYFEEQDKEKKNHAIRTFYLYRWQGAVTDLKIEEGAGAGFISLALDDFLTTYSVANPGEFKPCFFFEEYQPVWQALQSHLKLN